MSASIQTPAQLVEEFKKSGEFDRLRREIFLEFKQGDDYAGFMERVEEIVSDRLEKDSRILSHEQNVRHKELIQEVERFTVIDRVVDGCPKLSDPDFAEDIRENARRLLKGEKIPQRARGSMRDISDIPSSPMPGTPRREVVIEDSTPLRSSPMLPSVAPQDNLDTDPHPQDEVMSEQPNADPQQDTNFSYPTPSVTSSTVTNAQRHPSSSPLSAPEYSSDEGDESSELSEEDDDEEEEEDESDEDVESEEGGEDAGLSTAVS